MQEEKLESTTIIFSGAVAGEWALDHQVCPNLITALP